MKENKYEFHRLEMLWNIGEKLHLIEDYPENLWERINKYYYCGCPLSVLLKENFNQGKCYDRSYALTMAFNKCDLVRGSLPRYGKLKNTSYDHVFDHSWVEVENYVYDTTFMKKFNKKYYYFLFGAKVNEKVSSKELNNNEEYQKMKSTNKDDIENSLGTDALNAWLLDKVLDQKEQTTGRDLSYLRCEVPKIDIDEHYYKQQKRIKELINEKELEY